MTLQFDNSTTVANPVEYRWPADMESPPVTGVSESSVIMPVQLCALTEAIDVFGRWLHLSDPAPVLVTAAIVVANNTPGDPVWGLLVGPPSNGKTEIIQSTGTLPYIVKAALVTEAALLSGTSRKEKSKDATGGLLRKIGDYGILLVKDFTSVLSQNKDTSRSALAALREIYDGEWDRPVGTDGGKVLHWDGKCGLIGGVTPTIDRYGAVLGALGDRFILLRIGEIDPTKMATSALDQGDNEQKMRQELGEAMTGLIGSADHTKVNRPLTDEERNKLVRLATYTARSRTPVERNGYTREVEVLPEPEGPARLVKQYRRLLGGLEAIGADSPTAWSVLGRVARDCAPAMRTAVIAALLATPGETKTGDVAEAVKVTGRTARQQLEDLELLGLVDRHREGSGETATNWWNASPWLRNYYPRLLDTKNTVACTGAP